ncbi:MAG TPA: FkbM family methyltransferase [Candidatus Polarisedimenticolia bacterium]|nr:FkbM family methyltransferase [Candidatus Polarisedimenticolia bacterium]
MRRLLSRLASRAGAACFRLARAAYRSPAERRVEPWIRDRGDRTLRLDYDLDESSLVFDLGGYEGQWASDIFGRYACAIRIFEPVPEFADRIAERFRKNRKITVHRFGLGAVSGPAVLALAGDASSLYGSAGERRTIRLVKASDFFRDNGMSAVDLIKINIEGGEYDLLEHLIDAGLAGSLRDIQVQFHDFVPDAARRMARLEERLRLTHVPTYRYPFVWENWRLIRSAAEATSSGAIREKP